MKTIHYSNVFLFTVTLLLYLAVLLGFFAQFFLGCAQIVMALLLYFTQKSLKPKGFDHLSTYFIIVLTYGLVATFTLILEMPLGSFLSVFLYMVIPMCIATYFVFITHHYYTNPKQ